MCPNDGIYIKFLPEDIDVPVSQKDESVLDLALRHKISLNHTCGGMGTCGTCVVTIYDGLARLGPRNEVEAEMAGDRSYRDEERLACQIRPVAGLIVHRKP